MNLLSKNKLKSLVAYKAQKNCDADGVFVVEGVRLCKEALSSGYTIRTVCATAEWIASNKDTVPQNCELFEVDSDQLERLSGQKSPNKVWMLVERRTAERDRQGANGFPNGERRAENGERPNATDRERTVFQTESGERLILALDDIQDPGNMGTIIRTADWFGIRDIVCSKETVDCYNPKVIQSSMGGIFRTKIEYTSLTDYLKKQAEKGTAIYGAMLNGENVYNTLWHKPAIIVIGNEGKGISDDVAAIIQNRITIPNIGKSCESLNAAVATAILCSEFARKNT
ncbi:MAG: RNA methyltransferase [Bacteroidales bacterium]|nr:RNA methyltransferase [Bacteroidales bacterium]